MFPTEGIHASPPPSISLHKLGCPISRPTVDSDNFVLGTVGVNGSPLRSTPCPSMADSRSSREGITSSAAIRSPWWRTAMFTPQLPSPVLNGTVPQRGSISHTSELSSERTVSLSSESTQPGAPAAFSASVIALSLARSASVTSSLGALKNVSSGSELSGLNLAIKTSEEATAADSAALARSSRSRLSFLYSLN